MVLSKHRSNKAKKYLLNKSLQLFGIERNPELTKMGLKLSLSFAKNAQQTFLPSQVDFFFFFPLAAVEDLQAKVKAQKASAIVDTFLNTGQNLIAKAFVQNETNLGEYLLPISPRKECSVQHGYFTTHIY